MSDDQTRPIEPEGSNPPQPEAQPQPQPEAQPQAQPEAQPSAPQPAYAMPLPAGYAAYAAQQRPRFVDQVLGMRAVVAVALACLIIGGLSGWILGHAAARDDGRFGPGFMQRGSFPEGQNGFQGQQPDQQPDQQFGGPFGQGGR
jgi:uncharacterized membrane protein